MTIDVDTREGNDFPTEETNGVKDGLIQDRLSGDQHVINGLRGVHTDVNDYCEQHKLLDVQTPIVCSCDLTVREHDECEHSNQERTPLTPAETGHSNMDDLSNDKIFACEYSQSNCEHNGNIEIPCDESLKKLNGTSQESIDKGIDRDFDDLDRGWAWVVLFASFCSFVLLGNGMYAVGILHSVLLERFQASVSLTAWAGALHTALYSLGGPLSTAVIDRFSCRTAVVLSGVFFVIGFFATAFAPSVEVAIFTYGIVAGIGGGLGYTASMVMVSFYFKKRRNLAIGIAVSGVGAGIFALAPVTQFAREYYGTVGVFIFTAGIMSHQVLFGLISFPSKLERYIMLHRKTAETKLEKVTRLEKIIALLKPYRDVICNKGVVCLCLAMFLFCLGCYLLFVHLPTYIVSKEFTKIQASMFLSILGLASLPGRVISGIAADHVHPCIIYSGSFAIIALTIFIYPFIATNFAGQMAFMVVYGPLFGTGYILTSSMSLMFVDIRFLAAAIGLQFLFGGIGATVGPVLAGLIDDNGGSYDHSLILAAFCSLLAALCGGFSMCFKRPKADANLEIVVSEPTKEPS